MKEVKVRVDLHLIHEMTVQVEEGECPLEEARDLLYDAFDHDRPYYESVLAEADLKIAYVSELHFLHKMRAVMREFDPFGLDPGDFAPYEEYDQEADRLTRLLSLDLLGASPESIAKDIAKEYHRSFDQWFPVEQCLPAARDIHRYLQHHSIALQRQKKE